MAVAAYFEQQKVCPVCQTKFTVTRVRSSMCVVTKRDTDFHVRYRDVNPLLYAVWVCPDCHYAAIDKDFSPQFTQMELERLKKGLSLLKSEEPDFSGQRSPQVAFRALELAIRTAMIRQAPSIVLAGLYLRGAWMCRDMEKTEEEMKFLEEARKLYQQSFEKEWGRYSEKMSDSRIMYLIGELYRRLGNNEEAIKWFSRTVMNKDLKKEPEINRLVRDQWEQARTDYKKQQAARPGPAPAEAEATPASGGDAGDGRQAQPAPADPETTAKPKSRGSKVKMFVSIYMDQVEWLKNIANKAYDSYRVSLDKEAVVRALLDAVMEKCPDPGDFKTEEELKQLFMARLI